MSPLWVNNPDCGMSGDPTLKDCLKDCYNHCVSNAMTKRQLQKELIEQLQKQNALFRKDIELMLEVHRQKGVMYFRCLSCGMPAYYGQSSCELCPIGDK